MALVLWLAAVGAVLAITWRVVDTLRDRRRRARRARRRSRNMAYQNFWDRVTQRSRVRRLPNLPAEETTA